MQDVNLVLLIPKVKLSTTLAGLYFGSLNSVSQGKILQTVKCSITVGYFLGGFLVPAEAP